MDENINHDDLMAYTADIVSSYVANNNVAVDDIANVIGEVYKSLVNLGLDGSPAGERPQPAVPIKRSITPDYIICLEDGKKLKMLKRHLKTAYNMSPEEYRERWGLPADYPMVAPSYAEKRSKLAKDIGLGTKN